jgi:hypothetical protein
MRRREFIKVAAITAAAGGFGSPALGDEWKRRPMAMPKQVLGRTGVEVSILALGGGNGCLVAGNPFKDLMLPFHDETSHQVPAESLINYALGLPVSVAVIGVDSIDELKANVAIVKKSKFMTAEEQPELERIVG